jgi:hypothetical protein
MQSIKMTFTPQGDYASKYVLILLLMLFSWKCSKESITQVEQKNAKPGDSFELKAGEAIIITGTPVSFRFDSLLYDYRCPEGGECFWEGNAAILISFRDEKDTLSTFYRHEVTQGDYSVTLQMIVPYPKIGQQVQKDSYVAQFIVCRN